MASLSLNLHYWSKILLSEQNSIKINPKEYHVECLSVEPHLAWFYAKEKHNVSLRGLSLEHHVWHYKIENMRNLKPMYNLPKKLFLFSRALSFLPIIFAIQLVTSFIISFTSGPSYSLRSSAALTKDNHTSYYFAAQSWYLLPLARPLLCLTTLWHLSKQCRHTSPNTLDSWLFYHRCSSIHFRSFKMQPT